MYKYIIDLLTSESVSVGSIKIATVDGLQQHVGEVHRTSYLNSDYGRQAVVDELPVEVSQAILSFWGDSPTINNLIEQEV